MGAPAAIATIGPGEGIEFGTGKMPAAGATMSAPAKNSDPVNKITFLHLLLVLGATKRKYNLSYTKDTLMKLIITALFFLGLLEMQCTKRISLNAPPCIEQKIKQIKAQPKWNPPATVSEYMYSGKKVYLFTSNCCDQYIELYDSNCNYLCAPSGGITGKGDGKCADFYEKATLVRVVWKDER